MMIKNQESRAKDKNRQAQLTIAAAQNTRFGKG